jgi:hypothetical protein
MSALVFENGEDCADRGYSFRGPIKGGLGSGSTGVGWGLGVASTPS